MTSEDPRSQHTHTHQKARLSLSRSCRPAFHAPPPKLEYRIPPFDAPYSLYIIIIDRDRYRDRLMRSLARGIHTVTHTATHTITGGGRAMLCDREAMTQLLARVQETDIGRRLMPGATTTTTTTDTDTAIPFVCSPGSPPLGFVSAADCDV
jgi:hypothetical protein